MRTRASIWRSSLIAALLVAFAAGSDGVRAGASGDQYVGTNLNTISYFSPEQPFLNILKSASASHLNYLWLTSDSGSFDTNEEAYVQTDSDGYATSLTASPTPPGGQKFTLIQTQVLASLPSPPPGAATLYPSGQYTLQFQGAGTMTITGGAVSDLSSSTPGVSISGTQITSTMSAGTTATVTMTISPTTSNAIYLQINALPSSTNYLKAMSLVQSQYQAAYQNGEIFSPEFEAMLAPYSRLRFMDWMRTNTQDYRISFTGTLASGATSGTISSMTTTSESFSTWPWPSGTYNFIFGTGQTIAVTATLGSDLLSWGTPLSSALPTEGYGQAFYSPVQSWSNRPLLSNATWATNGVPLEAMAQLCNEVGVDGWFNIPGTAQAMGNWAQHLAELLYNGTGAVLTGSNLTSFSGLNPAHKAYIEYMNEYWNGAFSQAYLDNMMGAPLYGSNYPEWFGSQVAGIGDTFYSVYGSSAFASRVVVTMSQQSTNTYWLQLIMNTPDWTSRAYTHHIGAIHTGGYFGLDSMSSGDVSSFQAMSQTDQVNCYFSLAYSNVCGSTTFSSMPAIGYIPNIAKVTAADIAAVTGQSWASLPRVVYEGGSSNTDYYGSGSEWVATITAAHRDSRTQYLYYDPLHQLDSTGEGYFPRMVAAGIQSINVESDVAPVGTNGDYGALESIMQPISPLSSAPAKYEGIVSFVASSTSTSPPPAPVPSPPTNLTVR